MSSILLRNGTVIEFEPLRVERRDVLIVDGRMATRDVRGGADRETRILDCKGRYIMPGLVNAHSQLWSSQTLGLSDQLIQESTDTRKLAVREVLEPETVITATFSGALEAVRVGTTTLIDLHASPRCSQHILDLIHDAALSVGVRAVLSYDISSFDNESAQDAAFEENLEFIVNHRTDKVTGLIGLGDISRLSDTLLGKIAESARRSRQGVQVIAGVSAAQEAASHAHFGCSNIRRLENFGLLSNRTVVLHGIHLDGEDKQRINAHGAWIVFCPSAVARFGLSASPVHTFGHLIALGSGSALSDIFAESRLALMNARLVGSGFNTRDITRMVVGSHQLASEILGVELGSFRRDAMGDVLILNYPARTPLNADTLPDHFVYGMGPQHIESVIIDGNLVYQNGRYPDIDMGVLSQVLRRGAEQLWSAAREVSVPG